MEDDTPVVVSTTAETQAVLDTIANALLEKRMAACCQISGPIKSIYRWEGRIESSTEYSCTIKTVAKHVSQITRTIGELHPYDEPEIIVTLIVGGSESYLKWIADSVD